MQDKITSGLVGLVKDFEFNISVYGLVYQIHLSSKYQRLLLEQYAKAEMKMLKSVFDNEDTNLIRSIRTGEQFTTIVPLSNLTNRNLTLNEVSILHVHWGWAIDRQNLSTVMLWPQSFTNDGVSTIDVKSSALSSFTFSRPVCLTINGFPDVERSLRIFSSDRHAANVAPLNSLYQSLKKRKFIHRSMMAHFRHMDQYFISQIMVNNTGLEDK